MVGDAAQVLIDANGHTWPFERVRHLLGGSGIAIGNLETTITDRTEPYFPWAQWSYSIQPAAARALLEVGIDAVGLNNNHTMDRGPEGLADTLRYLREAGVKPFGAGMDIDEASAPLLVPTPHGTVAVLAFGDNFRQAAVAGPGQPGTIPYDEPNVAQAAARARAAGARWVVAFVHWGNNYQPIRPEQRRVAERFANAGYDLVIGHHPHSSQPVEIVNGVPVLYSLGNFVFGSPGRFLPEAPGYGIVARTTFARDGIASIELTCILTDNDVVKFQPRACDEPQARQLMQSLGPQVVWQNGLGIVRR
jgi:poly-gamma-glutamate capsule biosynthesis protein CapA/YwtB (metallophosphatase superfamily)